MHKAYIEREAALRAIADVQYMMYSDDDCADEYAAVNVVFNVVGTVPTADVVEVVRCRECKYYAAANRQCDHPDGLYLTRAAGDDSYCSYGERRQK